MEVLFRYYWVALFAGAAYLAIKRRGPILLILALLAIGLNPLIGLLLHRHVIEFELIDRYEEQLRYIHVGGFVALIVGIIQLAGHRAGPTASNRQSTSHDTGGASLTTLFIPRNETNSYTRAERLRDTVCADLSRSITAAGIRFIEQKSNAFSPEVWVRIDYQLAPRAAGVTLRASVEIYVERLDFHRFEHTLTVVARRGTEVVRIPGILELGAYGGARINQWVLHPGSKLKLPRRVREAPWQFWRPRNRVVRIRADWTAIAIGTLWMPLMILPPLGVVAFFVCVLVLKQRNKRRPVHVLTGGKPMSDPRNLSWLDSWQVTVSGLAPAAVALGAKVIERVRQGAPEDLVAAVERLGYWGVDSRVERDQIAVRYRRAIAFVHVVAHGDQLYVGWECHLNQAAWAEQTMQQGVDRITGLTVQANRVVSGWQRLNEYDLADANFLAEWVHESLKGELKLQMTEYRIDQEIDFTVQRESRKGAITGSATQESVSHQSPGKRLANLFSRVE